MTPQTPSSIEEHSSISMAEKGYFKMPQHGEEISVDTQVGESREIFQTQIDGVDFRTLSWQRATIVFVKIGFAMSILSIPEALATLGYVGGVLTMVGFSILNTCELEDTVTLITYGAATLTQIHV
jgi:hypothetical protein